MLRDMFFEWEVEAVLGKGSNRVSMQRKSNLRNRKQEIKVKNRA